MSQWNKGHACDLAIEHSSLGLLECATLIKEKFQL